MVIQQDFRQEKKDITRNESVAVSTTSLQLASNMNGKGGRRNIIIRNTSPNAIDIITITRGRNVAVAGAGIVLNQGEIWYDSTDLNSVCWQYEIQGICATINGTVSISEE